MYSFLVQPSSVSFFTPSLFPTVQSENMVHEEADGSLPGGPHLQTSSQWYHWSPKQVYLEPLYIWKYLFMYPLYLNPRPHPKHTYIQRPSIDKWHRLTILITYAVSKNQKPTGVPRAAASHRHSYFHGR